MVKKAPAPPTEAAVTDALLAQVRRIADVLELVHSPHSKMIICGHESLEGFRCIRGPNHVGHPHTNVNVQPPKIWADDRARIEPESSRLHTCDACGMVDAHEPDCSAQAKATKVLEKAFKKVERALEEVPPVGAPEAPPRSPAATPPSGASTSPAEAGAAAPTPKVTLGEAGKALAAAGVSCTQPCDFECGGTCGLALGHEGKHRCDPSQHNTAPAADLDAGMKERELLVRALGPELASQVAALADETKDPTVAIAVKTAGVARLGEAGFVKARDACGIGAGKCPTGAQLRRFALEAMA